MATFLESALVYARKGWPVVPLEPRGKKPITARGIYDATTEEEIIRRWWQDTPKANIGIVTGSKSGLLVIDIDGSRGAAAWEGLSRRGIPPTLSQRTGRDEGGSQYFFTAPSKPIQTREQIFTGLDVQADGGWVVVPPSIHPSGRPYKWVTKTIPVEAPDWLIELVRRPPPITAPQIQECSKEENDLCAPPHTDDDDPGIRDAFPLIADAISEDIAWYDALIRNKDGGIKSCASNALKIVHNHKKLAGLLKFNERKHAAVWVESPPWRTIRQESPELIDEDAVYLCEFLADVTGIVFSKTLLLDAMIADARRRPFDPVIEYLTGLRWDGIARLDGWLFSYFGAKPTKYILAVSAAWAISAVARAFRPGCQADYMIVLEGLNQGEKKSTGISILASDEFYTDIKIDPSSKDSVMAMHGPWIVEWGELAGLSKREAETVKSFLTRRSDRVRPPYGRTTVDLPRRVVVAGTTNEEVYLTDPTGNRRYWPVKIRECARDELARDRDQIWAEAVARFNAGEKWYLDDEIERLAREEQEQRSVRDPWEDPVWNMLDNGDLKDRNFISTTEILLELKVDTVHQHTGIARRVAAIMRRIGWFSGQRRVNGATLRGWVRPQQMFED